MERGRIYIDHLKEGAYQTVSVNKKCFFHRILSIPILQFLFHEVMGNAENFCYTGRKYYKMEAFHGCNAGITLTKKYSQIYFRCGGINCG